jgi:hypothetical protein
MAAQYFEDSDIAISEHLDGNLFVLTNNILNMFAKLQRGNMAALQAIIMVLYPMLKEEITMYWLDAVNHGVDISSILQGVDYLVSQKEEPNGPNTMFKFNPNGYTLQTIGSPQHKLLSVLIKRGLINANDIEGIIDINTLHEDFANLLRSESQKRNILKNIPGAATNKTARRILKEKLNMSNRLGPINTISKMIGAPATVARGRRATRRRKN